MMSSPNPLLKKIHLHKVSKTLELFFDGHPSFVLPAEFLRVHSPSAEVQGHFGKGGTLPHSKKEVGILGLHPVGNYGIRIDFDDGHQSGYYRWSYLYELASMQEKLWQDYLLKLEAAGKYRDAGVSAVRFVPAQHPTHPPA